MELDKIIVIGVIGLLMLMFGGAIFLDYITTDYKKCVNSCAFQLDGGTIEAECFRSCLVLSSCNQPLDLK